MVRHAKPSLFFRFGSALWHHKGAVLFNVFFLVALVVALELGLTYVLDHPELLANNPAMLNAARIIHDEERVVSIQYMPQCAQYDPRTTYRLRPGSCLFESTEFSNELLINSAGLRDDEASLEAPEIIVLGDSFAMGWGVDQDQTFAAGIEKLTGMRTLNAGISSFGTVREMRMLSSLDRSGLKVLVIQYCDNDYRENKTFFEGGNRLEIMSQATYKARQDNAMSQKYWFGRYANRLRKSVSHIIGQRLRSGGGQKATSTDTAEAKVFVNALEHGAADLSGVKVIVLELVPNARHDSAFISALKREAVLPGHPKWIQSLSVLDVSMFLSDADHYVLDDHITAGGHAKVAQALAKAITSSLDQ